MQMLSWTKSSHLCCCMELSLTRLSWWSCWHCGLATSPGDRWTLQLRHWGN